MEDVKKLVNKIISAAQDRKAKDIVTVDMTGMIGAICQYFVICEGNTPTQVSAISDHIVDYLKAEMKERPISVEGEKEARWIGIDYGTVIVHIFIPELREFYNIENLWEDAVLENIPDID
ncbi:ribosome silencing factor [Dysgonomonas sp. 520]|uniref:ribosome silencing factor n=1 Tax=Dysgonomonas sp. 520 TaxID=2302931 RepID=UPI0013D23153|nr:ribosome silencing factor [Dysgonomonas sp. 520]NDW08131.1 ribosome silencing factor [Dysgonomonas sp. 520]